MTNGKWKIEMALPSESRTTTPESMLCPPTYSLANSPLLQFEASSQSRLLITLLSFRAPGSYTYIPLLVIVNMGTRYLLATAMSSSCGFGSDAFGWVCTIAIVAGCQLNVNCLFSLVVPISLAL